MPAVSASRQPLWLHVLFFASLAVGGLVSELAAGGLHPAFTLRGDLAAKVLGDGPVRLGLLLLGGVLVGFGTRMAGGCTSGHGLCGLSRLQKGSILSTACFFGAGIGVGFLLRGLA